MVSIYNSPFGLAIFKFPNSLVIFILCGYGVRVNFQLLLSKTDPPYNR